MKELSPQDAAAYWTYLHDQAEREFKASLSTGEGSPYKDEKRAAAELYQQIGKMFSINFKQSVTSANDVRQGLTAEQVTAFMAYLDQQIGNLQSQLEKTRLRKQEALAEAQEMEHHNVKRIYKEMENLKESQINAFKNARRRFLGILQVE